MQLIQDLIDNKVLPKKIWNKGFKINSRESKRQLKGFNATTDECVTVLYALVSDGFLNLNQMKKHMKFLPDSFLKEMEKEIN